MDVEENIKIINNFIQNIENGFTISKEISSWEPEKRIVKAIEHILAKIEELKILEDDLKDKRIVYVDTPEFEEKFIPKQKVKEELEKAEKENEPYEQHNKESRMYWINEGKMSLAKKLLEDK